MITWLAVIRQDYYLKQQKAIVTNSNSQFGFKPLPEPILTDESDKPTWGNNSATTIF